MIRSALVIVFAFTAGCTASLDATAPRGPQTVAELRDACAELVTAPDLYVRLDQITGRIPGDALDSSLSSRPAADDFDREARGADGVWTYDATDRMGTMVTGERGIVALKGCRIVAQQTQIIFN